VTPDVAGMPTWQYLGLQKELAMVHAARQFLPYGAILLLIGGIFSTLSALNATIYSSARVAFAMGRDHNLPGFLAQVNEKAVFVSGLLIAAMALSLPIEHVASAADIMFLLLFLMVNLALINLRRLRPDLERGYKVPLFPWLSAVGIAFLIGLAVYMLNYSLLAWAVAAGWIVLGVAIYYLYSRPAEHAAKAAPILVSRKARLVLPRKRVLAAVGDHTEAGPLVRLACDLAGRDGEVEVVTVVEVPGVSPLSSGVGQARRREKTLRLAEEVGHQEKTAVGGHVRISHNVARAILDSIEEVRPELLVLGWRTRTATGTGLLGTTVGPLVELAPTDVAVVRGAEDIPLTGDGPLRILIPTAGGPHATEGIRLAVRLERNRGAKITVASVVRPDAAEERRREVLEVLGKTVAEAWDREARDNGFDEGGQSAGPDGPPVAYKLLENRSVVPAILAEAEDHDLVLLGASNEGLLRNITLGSIPEAVVRYSDKPVMVVRNHEGAVKTWLRRFLGTYRASGVEIR